MPKWGLTPEMRTIEPWGLAAAWLEPEKVVTDPVHGDVYLTHLETRLLDSPPMQRLRRVYQLGTTHLVYPGATHTRFSHSIGALRVAQDLLDVVVDQRSAPKPVRDLFRQWEDSGPNTYAKKVAEATVLARLGGLLHDLCHVPFGHSIEDDLGILVSHDENRDRFKAIWSQLDRDLRDALEGDLLRNLEPLIISKVKRPDFTPRYPFVEDIVGNTICADLLDYIRRDHLFTGLPLALGRRFEASFYVTPEEDPNLSARMVLRIVRADGKGERTDTVTELLKHLRYRYELSERALVHHAKLAADAMIGKALEIWRDALLVETLDRLPWDKPPSELITDMASAHEAVKDAFSDHKARTRHAEKDVRESLDRSLRQHGDDGLLEHLRDLPAQAATDGVRLDVDRRRAVGTLANHLLNRRLVKRSGIQSKVQSTLEVPKGTPEDFYKTYGGADVRGDLERAAARFAGVRPAWKILLWIPDPRMRLKVAEVLVDDGPEIQSFIHREAEGRRRGVDIYNAHFDLWALSVFASRDVADDPALKEPVLAYFARRFNMKLGGLESRLGEKTYEWPDRLAAARAIGKLPNDPAVGKLMLFRRKEIAAYTPESASREPTFNALVAKYRELAKA